MGWGFDGGRSVSPPLVPGCFPAPWVLQRGLWWQPKLPRVGLIVKGAGNGALPMPHVPRLLCQCDWRAEELLPRLFPIQDLSDPAAEERSVSAGTEGPAGLWEPGMSSLLYPHYCFCFEMPIPDPAQPRRERQENPQGRIPSFLG